ncbi:MAG: nickel-responsive transcriptional regulator NikR [candidate division WOR-3 bacterium]|nr:nickel-responsive transcriptional regulator NikR [candidate division WOR-3 bacterium]
MKKSARFGVSMEQNLLKDFDELLERIGYTSRSEAVRDLIREKLVEKEWQDINREVVGIITIVYSHTTRELSENLTAIQHHYYKQIISTTHIHLDHNNCLEVLIVRGKSVKIKEIAERLISTRGVKHGRLTTTTTGKKLT